MRDLPFEMTMDQFKFFFQIVLVYKKCMSLAFKKNIHDYGLL